MTRSTTLSSTDATELSAAHRHPHPARLGFPARPGGGVGVTAVARECYYLDRAHAPREMFVSTVENPINAPIEPPSYYVRGAPAEFEPELRVGAEYSAVWACRHIRRTLRGGCADPQGRAITLAAL